MTGAEGVCAEPVTLAQIVAALSVTYTDDGVLTWLTSPNRGLRAEPFPDGTSASPLDFMLAGRIAEVVAAVSRIGDCDPREVRVDFR